MKTTPLLQRLRVEKESNQNGGNGYLSDTCLTAQDDFKAVMKYFRV